MYAIGQQGNREEGVSYSRLGSAVPVRLIELRTYGLHRRSTSAARLRATALENECFRAGVGLWPLYFETGHWCGDFLANRRTGSGRLCEFAAAPV